MYTSYIPQNMHHVIETIGYPVSEFGGFYDDVSYAELFDWLKNEKGIHIILDPFFTMAFKDHTAYTWELRYISNDKFVSIKESDVWESGAYGGSFNAAVSSAINYIRHMWKSKPTQDEINKIIEVYHKFPEKKITKEMIFEARKKTYLGLNECKRILEDYIKTLEKNE